MTIKLVCGQEERLMTTDNGIPRVGDTVEFVSGSFAKVVRVRWNLLRTGPDAYKPGYITHQATVTLVASGRRR